VVRCAGCVKRTCKYLQMCRYLILSADVDIYLISSTDKIIENHPGREGVWRRYVSQRGVTWVVIFEDRLPVNWLPKSEAFDAVLRGLPISLP
jgi:hypothetical protein